MTVPISLALAGDCGQCRDWLVWRRTADGLTSMCKPVLFEVEANRSWLDVLRRVVAEHHAHDHREAP